MGLPIQNDLGLFSRFKRGELDLITDVTGVTVGNVTIKSNDVNTGVTAILPHGGDLFREKVTAGASIINGFGKSMGLLQLMELGTIESPIIMTNTFGIGTAYTALVKYMLERDPDIGVFDPTINCVITECNDGRLNDIRGLHVTEEHVLEAVTHTSCSFEEGAVGGGTGMKCFGLKGGIGSASRIVKVDNTEKTIGAIVMTNFGRYGDLVIGGRRIEQTHSHKEAPTDERDKGSVIVVIATDIPLSDRQLTRVARRSMISLGRTGSFCGNGSGDIAIAFSTANIIHQHCDNDTFKIRVFDDSKIDRVFDAAVETVEEAVISSLYHATTTTGIRNTTVESLSDFLATDRQL